MDILRDDGSSSTPPSTSDSPASPVSAPPSPAPSPAPEFRYQSGPYAGRTADEVAQYAQQAMQQLQAQQYAPAPAAPRADAFDLDRISDSEYVDGAQLKRIVAGVQQQMRGPDPFQAMARSNVAFARSQRADDFRRFGPEIDLELSKLTPDQQSLDNINLLVDLVRSRHLQELIDEAAGRRAQQLVSQMEPTTRALGGAGSGPLPHTQPTGLLDQIPEAARQKIVAVGLNETTLRAHLAEQGISLTEFLKPYGVTPAPAGGAV